MFKVRQPEFAKNKPVRRRGFIGLSFFCESFQPALEPAELPRRHRILRIGLAALPKNFLSALNQLKPADALAAIPILNQRWQEFAQHGAENFLRRGVPVKSAALIRLQREVFRLGYLQALIGNRLERHVIA